MHKVWFSFSRQPSSLQREFAEAWCSSSRKRYSNYCKYYVKLYKHFFRSCKFSSAETITENYSGEKFRKGLCSDNLDKADKAGDLYDCLTLS